LAIVAAIVFFGVLAGGTLLILESWQENEVPLRLGAVPGMEGTLGDAVAVASAPGLGVASARVAPAGRTALVAAAAPLGGVAAGPGSSRSAIAPALAVVAARPGAPSPPASESPAALQPQPAPVPTEPAAVPVSVPVPAAEATPPGRGGFEGGMQGPIGSGVGEEESPSGPLQASEGSEYVLTFSFDAQPGAYLAPGVENLIVRIGDASEGQPSFGLQLWDDGSGSRHGLWSSGGAMGGERFLAPVVDGVRHEVVVDFRAAGGGDGFYLVFLDGQPIDAAAGVSLIEAGSGGAQIEVGLFRNGEVQEASGVLVGAATLVPLQPALP
jgi:hypothetical protein